MTVVHSFQSATKRLRPPAARVRRVLAPMTGLAWGVLVASIACWVLGWRFGWVELMQLAVVAIVLFALCALLMLGRTRLRVEVEVEPRRVVVGTPAAGQVVVTNASRRVLLPSSLELPIGPSGARFGLPTMRGGASHEELFVVPTERRGVVGIGPALTVRGDPLGLFRRTVSWTGVIELFVHPRTVPLEPLGAGLLRDLEGQTTNDLSMSDLAFHALREYQPGDDRRFIHWRSSAKAGKFLVRQFLDTRRSHVTIVVDSDERSYVEPDDYEMAISVAASVAVRSIRDEQDVSVVAGNQAVPKAQGRRVLDAFSRAELSDRGLRTLAPVAAGLSPETSIALIITGSLVPFGELQRAMSYFPSEVRAINLRTDPAAPTSATAHHGMTVLSLRTISELPALLMGTFQ
jgi:uncharacterized protein (DUF58 family)